MTKLRACIVAVGSEMLTPFRVDTNSLVITERLNAIGCDVRLKVVVGDSVDELARVLTAALDSVDLIVCTGGLGPTADDITRDALTRVLGMPLEIDEASVEHIRARFARRGIPMPDINRRQAMVPDGGVVLANVSGTAPGLSSTSRCWESRLNILSMSSRDCLISRYTMPRKLSGI